MNRKKTMVAAFAGVLVVIFVFALTWYFSGRSENTLEVLLPTPIPTGNSNYTDPNHSGNTYETTLRVTVDTVQDVISTMNRPEGFSQDISVTSSWSDGKSTYDISTWSRKGITRTSISSSELRYKKEIILTSDKLYIWYEGESKYYSGKPGDISSADDYQMIPTYEDVLEIKKTDVLEAGFEPYNNEPCIFVRAHTGDLGYIDKFYISVVTGLLVAAETYDGDTVIYSMTAKNVTLNLPPDDKFLLPDGKSAIIS